MEISARHAAFVSAAADEIGLKIDATNEPEVIENFARIAAIAEFLTQFPLTQEIEAVPVFRP